MFVKDIGGYRRSDGKQMHVEILVRHPRVGKVMAAIMTPALQPDH